MKKESGKARGQTKEREPTLSADFRPRAWAEPVFTDSLVQMGWKKVHT